jgi:hypothetical protein
MCLHCGSVVREKYLYRIHTHTHRGSNSGFDWIYIYHPRLSKVYGQKVKNLYFQVKIGDI